MPITPHDPPREPVDDDDSSTSNSDGEMEISPLRICGNDALVSAVPYLVGFEPEMSMVLVWIESEARRVVLTMRVDLPVLPVTKAAIAMTTEVLTDPVRGVPDGALPCLVVVGSPSDDDDAGADEGPGWPEGLPYAELVNALTTRLTSLHRPPIEALYVAANRWWSYLCANSTCCDLCGRAVDESVRLEVQAQFVLMGRAVLPSRETVRAEIAPAPTAHIRRVRTMVAALGVPVGKPRRGGSALSFALRARCWRSMHLVATRPEAVELDDHVAMLAGLRDVRMRDAFIALVLQHDLATVLPLLRSTVAMAPRYFVAPIAATVALLSYLDGDGARAWIALDRSRVDDPGYSLAFLVSTALGAGLSPAPLRELFASFNPDDLRAGRVVLGAA